MLLRMDRHVRVFKAMIEADNGDMAGDAHPVTTTHLAGNAGIWIDRGMGTELDIAAYQRMPGNPGMLPHHQMRRENPRIGRDIGAIGKLRTRRPHQFRLAGRMLGTGDILGRPVPGEELQPGAVFFGSASTQRYRFHRAHANRSSRAGSMAKCSGWPAT